MKRALIITRFCLGFHNYRSGIDQELLGILPEDLLLAERDDPEKITLAELREYDLILFYCAGTWGLFGDSAFLTGLITYVASGGSVMILHVNCLGQSEEGGAVFGGRFSMHPPYGRYHMVPVGKERDPILQGVSDFYVNDEMHMLYVDSFLKKEVLLYCECTDSDLQGRKRPPLERRGAGTIPHQDIYGTAGGLKVPVAWRYDYGAGKVLYILPGHNAQTLREPNLRRLIRNGSRWLLESIEYNLKEEKT